MAALRSYAEVLAAIYPGATAEGHDSETIQRLENWISELQAGIDLFRAEVLEMLSAK